MIFLGKDDTCVRYQRYEFLSKTLLLGETDGRLCLCYWEDAPHEEVVVHRIVKQVHAVEKQTNRCLKTGASEVLTRTIQQLEEYLERDRRYFDLPFCLLGTDFQVKVWNALSEVPYGATCSYRQLAERVGRPHAVRAVANAVAHNPLQIILPCHRIISANGNRLAYAGGPAVKSRLLHLESPQ